MRPQRRRPRNIGRLLDLAKPVREPTGAERVRGESGRVSDAAVSASIMAYVSKRFVHKIARKIGAEAMELWVGRGRPRLKESDIHNLSISALKKVQAQPDATPERPETSKTREEVQRRSGVVRRCISGLPWTSWI